MNRKERRAAERGAKPTSNAVPDAIHRECDRLLKAVLQMFDLAGQRSPALVMRLVAPLWPGRCVVVMPIPLGEKPADDAERLMNARWNDVPIELVIDDFRKQGDAKTALMLENIGPGKLPVVAYVPVHETLTQTAIACIEYRVLSPGGSA